MHKRWLLMVGVATFGGLALLGCKEDEPAEPQDPKVEMEEPEAEEPEEMTEEDLPDFAPDEPKTKVDDLPTPMDYEEEAQEAIAPENLEAELDRLEAEILE